MERQVKERFVGAAVLVALAVILIPELLSGPKNEHKPAATAAPNEQSIKTYEFKLDAGATPSARVNEPTAAPPSESMPIATVAESERAPPTEQGSAEVKPPQDGSAAAPATEPVAIARPSASVPTASASASAAANKSATTPGWAVQLGSFADEERAQRLVQRLRAAGHNAYLVPLRRSDGKTLQRVRIGPYDQRAAAETALQRVAGEAKGATIVPQS